MYGLSQRCLHNRTVSVPERVALDVPDPMYGVRLSRGATTARDTEAGSALIDTIGFFEYLCGRFATGHLSGVPRPCCSTGSRGRAGHVLRLEADPVGYCGTRQGRQRD
jgi:hypothetical protein